MGERICKWIEIVVGTFVCWFVTTTLHNWDVRTGAEIRIGGETYRCTLQDKHTTSENE